MPGVTNTMAVAVERKPWIRGHRETSPNRNVIATSHCASNLCDTVTTGKCSDWIELRLDAKRACKTAKTERHYGPDHAGHRLEDQQHPMLKAAKKKPLVDKVEHAFEPFQDSVEDIDHENQRRRHDRASQLPRQPRISTSVNHSSAFSVQL